jgi:hypothetical protein
MSPKPSEESYSEEEIAQRRDKALLRALSTPPKPHSAMKIGKRAKPKSSSSSSAKPRKRGPSA